MGIGHILRVLKPAAGQVSDENYELSRRRFIVEGCLANAVAALTSGAFLIGFANYMGSNDQINGIIVSIPLLTALIQLFSPLVFERLKSRKRLVVALCLSYRVLLGLMVLVPFITENRGMRLFLLGFMYFLAYSAGGFLNPAAGSWLISLVPERMRGKYFGLRDMCILASTAGISLLMGRILDIFKSNDRYFIGFAVVFAVVLVLAFLNFNTIRRIKEPEVVQLSHSLNLKSVFTIPVKHKKFRKIILLNIIWNLSAQLSLPFFSVYMVTGLKLSYTFIMIMGIILSSVQAVSAKIWGKISEKHTWEYTTVVSIALIGICHVTWIFVTHATYFILIPIIQVLAGIAWAGVNMSLFNIQFKYAPQEGRTIFIGFNAAVSGLAGFCSALIGAVLVGALSGAEIDIGITVLDNMRLVFGVSGLLVLGCSAFFTYWFKDKKVS